MSRPLLVSESKSTGAGRQTAVEADWVNKRAQLRARMIKRRLPWVTKEELEAHFAGMPWRYWTWVSEDDLQLHLRTVRAFFQSLTAPETEGTAPVVHWRELPDRAATEVLVCTWDRHGLLVKVAGALATVRINIVRAVAYTRTDNVVLDVFEVCDLQNRPLRDEARLHKMACLLEAAVSQPPAVSFVAARPVERKETGASDRLKHAPSGPTIHFDNESSTDSTIVEIDTPDRLGLLYEILQVLTCCGVNISQAIVNTAQGLARDVFYVSDAVSGTVLGPSQLAVMRARLLEALGS